jgi:hypothetical protein
MSYHYRLADLGSFRRLHGGQETADFLVRVF